jgi:hypothetical protein
MQLQRRTTTTNQSFPESSSSIVLVVARSKRRLFEKKRTARMNQELQEEQQMREIVRESIAACQAEMQFHLENFLKEQPEATCDLRPTKSGLFICIPTVSMK